ncbi:MAG: amino acid adenylation domain-containing protein [Clostridia bacterium]|nr:amino acid adenylation domain-containing protein [Clostridia bacterium]
MKYLILDYLEATAARLPDKTAFTDESSAVTFAQLVHLSRAVGSALTAHVAPRTTVGFYMDKSVSAVAGFLGAVYAGCAYSLLNLRHPAVRIRAILDTLSSPVVITDRAHEQALREMDVLGEILILEDLLQGAVDDGALARVRRQMLDIDPLYVNFTSGSTGTPKGVIICHRNVCDFIPCFTEIFSITQADVLGNQAPFDFDVSVKDIYSGIFTGATVAIIPTAYFTQPTKLMDFICDQQVTVLVWAVSALCFITTMNALDYKTPETLRTIMFSGEVMPIKHLKKLQKYLPDATYVNLYGPTEITCNCTYYIVDREFEIGKSLPIGIPFPNERILLLDENDREVVPGGVGELCVSGTAVALGYFGDSERTKAAFVQNPLNKTHHEIIYRTGDLVRLTEEGELVYVSRKDFQIKHMGHRIELGEIETALQAVPGVERALCIYLHDKGKILAFTCGAADKAAITEALHVSLPTYMIPNIFMQVDEMPMTKNGKIDRSALLELYKNKKRGGRNG